MPLVFVAIWAVVDIVTVYVIFPVIGLEQGAILLFAHSTAGWSAAIITWALLALAPVTGLVLAARALRRGGRTGAWLALALNSLTALLTAYFVFDQLRMTYFPQFTFPFGA